MLTKCAIILFLASIPVAYTDHIFIRQSSQKTCPHPHIEHGRVRMRNRAKLVKFTCLYRYELVGNRYGSCMNGVWDVSIPVCVRSGCPELPATANAVQLKSHKDAWVETFCMPGYKLQGSPAIYCDGYKWNGTAPKCIDEDTPVINDASCDFEDPNLCGWMQDELHDFDWTRWSNNTPSFYLRTGPSFDHTLGMGKNGHYMYLESTGVRYNKTACLLSPVIDSKMALDGCFSFYYHMYGRNMGGLRVYQKPNRLELQQLLQLPEDERKNYLLFEQWGDVGNFWLGAAPKLKDLQDDFQIVIEGVAQLSFANDIAFDDVAILQGQNCSKFRNAVGTTPDISGSCQNRCRTTADVVSLDCDCSPACELIGACCEDYLELCVWSNNADGDDSSPSVKPQTEKLISETTTTTLTTSTTTQTPTSTQLTTRTTQPTKMTTRTTKQPTTTVRRTTMPVTTKPTTKKIPTTPPTTTHQTTTKATTQKRSTATVSTTTVRTTVVNKLTTKDYREIDKAKREDELQIQKIITVKHEQKSTLSTTMITIVALGLIAAFCYMAVMLTTARGRILLARLRARASHDSEVRYLSSNDDDL